MKSLMVASVVLTCALLIFMIVYVLFKGAQNISVTIHSRPVGMTSQAGISPLPDRV